MDGSPNGPTRQKGQNQSGGSHEEGMRGHLPVCAKGPF